MAGLENQKWFLSEFFLLFQRVVDTRVENAKLKAGVKVYFTEWARAKQEKASRKYRNERYKPSFP